MGQTLNNNKMEGSNLTNKKTMNFESIIKKFWIVFISLTAIFIINKQFSTNSVKKPLEYKNNSIGTKKMETKELLTKSDCLRLYGTAPDMSAWELAQAECMLQQNDYKTACDCMVILSK